MAIPADLVVLVTGMVPRENDELVGVLKLPVGNDGFFNEIHPKLRPVETIVDGVLICGACQSPKNSAESVASGLAAVTQSGAMLKRGFAELDPHGGDRRRPRPARGAASARRPAPTGPSKSRSELGRQEGKVVAHVIKTACKGCGGCVPVCPADAIDLQGYTDAQIKAMIDGLLEVSCT